MKPVCLITGAGGRLGSALCADLVDAYDIIAVYRSTVPPVNSQLRRRVENLSTYVAPDLVKTSVHCIQADLSLREDVRRLVEVSLARFGRIDSVVNAAADTKFHGRLTEIWEDRDYAQQQLLVNCVVPFHLISAIFQASWKDVPNENAEWNRNVINVSSVSALQVNEDRGQAFYSASKAALNMLTLYLSLELAPYSVRVNAICPGRFTNPASTAQVVKGIRKLLKGTSTGLVTSDP